MTFTVSDQKRDARREDQPMRVFPESSFRRPLSFYRRKIRAAKTLDEQSQWFDALEDRMRELDEERELRELHDQVRDIELKLQRVQAGFEAMVAADEERRKQEAAEAKQAAIESLFAEVEAIGRQKQRARAAEARQAAIFTTSPEAN